MAVLLLLVVLLLLLLLVVLSLMLMLLPTLLHWSRADMETLGANRRLHGAELRERRLQALGLASPAAAQPAAAGTGASQRELQDIWSIIWQPSATDDDKRRWHSQGFKFSAEADGIPFGLEQDKGGPCGVLAAIQAEMLRSLIFGDAQKEEDRPGTGELPAPSETEREQALVHALATVLQRAAVTERYGPASGDGGGVVAVVGGDAGAYDVERVPAADSERLARALQRVLPQLRSAAGGIVLFLLSLVLTRGAAAVRADMDSDAGARLTGEFGHCTQELLDLLQELLNLLLCGCAVSNTHDGNMYVGELVLRGIPARPPVGYLSHLEYLHYVKIGTLFKTPQDPVWVVGSASHFTVLFGVTRESIQESESKQLLDRESESKQLLDRVQRAFQAVDTSESGFIPVDKLQQVLSDLLPELAGDASKLGFLRSKLEMAGAGIVIWSDFWRAVSQLLTGTTLEALLRQEDGAAAHPAAAAAAHGSADGGGGGARPRSDSDVARELQRQFDTAAGGAIVIDDDGGGGGGSSARPRSDSDVARQLQREFDNGGGGAEAAAAANSLLAMAVSPAAAAAPAREGIRRHDSVAQDDAPAVALYHLNGLVSGHRRPALRQCALQRREEGSAIGHGVALWEGASVGGVASSAAIDDVLRTRWPGCRVTWVGGIAPSLD
ncbi:hypothetical protein JKP88DRAFT_316433 [Tribonema minus]|uniref:ubiquitinyl hydrolase 1 n=1 Tax=Tribonema minus TaxID=303371 RepID=A0A835YZH9_9STRA|nr:hypothetical protein JKP88DRAFT_316433 [Tribonema minus]